MNKRRFLAIVLSLGAGWLCAARADEPAAPSQRCETHACSLLPLVCRRLLPQAGAAGSADAVSLVLFAVLPQAAAADSADAVPVVSELLLPQAAGSGAA